MEEFKKELKALLEKYNAEIHVVYSNDSDTYALYDEKMVAVITTKKPFKQKEFVLCNADYLSKNNL
ncbi:MAG: hypothetical protein EOM23_01770 [Candidatus Moranbacteria bacterium]|nr:hypothetical protein [Candidatus Moranbacteria bacterium]